MRIKILMAVLLLAVSVSCAPKHKTGSSTAPPDNSPIADIKDFPQNLEVFAAQYGKNRQLVPAQSQQELFESWKRIVFGSWQMAKTSIPRRDVSSSFSKARGYKQDGMPWTQTEWDEMRANASLASYPALAMAAITLRNTDLRELPTSAMRLAKPVKDIREDPFDYFQYALLPIGTPLLVAHRTADGKWYYVECPVAGGWVNAADVGFVDDGFKAEWQKGNYAALIRDHVLLPGTGANGATSRADIGAVLPLASRSPGNVAVLVPVAGSGGYARSAEVNLTPRDAAPMPLPLTPGNVAKIGNEMMGQPYGWGGMLGERDCSAMIRDIFTPFGLWLPRNSVAQARRGSIIPLEGYDWAEKEKIILADGVPFLSLLGMRGHITLYIGQWKGRPAIFHNVWGVRIERDGNDNERHVIGKAVVTSITPGMELQNLYRPVTFVDRLRTLTHIGVR